jgi:hypothetical protein
MRYAILLLLLSSFSFSLPSCAQKATTQRTKNKRVSEKTATGSAGTKAKTEAGPVLTFERTPCFGTCPGYIMQVYADGRVAYEGRRAVPIMGKQDLKIPATAVTEMLHQAQEAHFDQFEDKYSRYTSDLPSIIVAIRQPSGKLKTVVSEEGTPANVLALFNSFATRFDQLAKLGGIEK